MRMPLAGLLAVLCLFGPARPLGAAEPRAAADLDTVCRWLAGEFSSEAQSRRDTSFFDIRLRIVPIWRPRTDARWFYVEQAAADRLERPYRQRVYRLTVDEQGTVESAVFALPAPLRFAGEWRQPAPLGVLRPDSLLSREGCSVFLRRQPDGTFRGGTRGTICASDLRGAAYATSEVVLSRERMVTLDRGFEAGGRQVWGSTRGGYEFVRTGGR